MLTRDESFKCKLSSRETDLLVPINEPPATPNHESLPEKRCRNSLILKILTAFFLSASICVYVWLKLTTCVVVWGDSLVKFSENYPLPHQQYLRFRFFEKLASGLKDFYPDTLALFVRNSGLEAQDIDRMRRRIWWQVDPFFPDAVVMIWESDVTETWEEEMTPLEIDRRRASYKAHLATVLNHLKQFTRVPFIVATGPILIGEKPRGMNRRTPQNVNETLGLDAIQDQYVDMTAAECARHGVEYVDARSAFFSAEPSGWENSTGWLTIGGGHLSQRGVSLLTSLILDRFKKLPAQKSSLCELARRAGLSCPYFGSFLIGSEPMKELSLKRVH